ncbi:MAG: hypothetical protein HPY83_18320 [Anaerolineae bacterium]|nr:hypothetical protein [Anaerolineae bacterium]
MTDLSKLVYKASKGELRIDELTEDAAALARFELSNEERVALQRHVRGGQWTNFVPMAEGGWI